MNCQLCLRPYSACTCDPMVAEPQDAAPSSQGMQSRPQSGLGDAASCGSELVVIRRCLGSYNLRSLRVAARDLVRMVNELRADVGEYRQLIQEAEKERDELREALRVEQQFASAIARERDELRGVLQRKYAQDVLRDQGWLELLSERDELRARVAFLDADRAKLGQKNSRIKDNLRAVERERDELQAKLTNAEKRNQELESFLGDDTPEPGKCFTPGLK